MLTFLKKLFKKAEPKAAAPAPTAPTPSAPMPTIQVAHLSLAAITVRFSEDLQTLLAQEPDASATVALPLPTIHKQLPSGSVKMSLASLQRQAPGLLKSIPPGDKRMVEVPLGEVFRHIRPHTLRRRADQRPFYVPESGYNLFGDSTNPYAVAPDDENRPMVLDLSQEIAGPETIEEPRVLKMDDGLREHFGNTSSAQSQRPSSASVSELQLETTSSSPLLATAPPANDLLEAAATAPIARPQGPTLALKVRSLAAQWPDGIRAEIEALDPAISVSLPLDEVSAGLAKGRVNLSWGQIRAWLEPALEAPTSTAENTALSLPLKIVAPAFLSASRSAKATRKSIAVDPTIPALFNDHREPAPPAPTAESASATEAAATVATVVPAAAPSDPQKLPTTIGELFDETHQRDWTPSEIVARTIKLPGVAGAIVALQEGLQVAASLPDGVKSEVVAAFLPQIFARLNQYSTEMKLGEVDDLLFTTHGAHCQIYRLGYVYLAVLGKPGESLPWPGLRLIAEELARQTHK